MLSRLVLLASMLFVVIACSREAATPSAKPAAGAKTTSTAPPDLSTAKIDKQLIPDAALQFTESSMLGSLLDRDGNVLGDKSEFKKGERIALTMRFRDSPSGLRTTAVFSERYGKDVATMQKDMNGSKIATFVLPKGLPPGRYKVTGYWGGNIAIEREFQVTK